MKKKECLSNVFKPSHHFIIPSLTESAEIQTFCSDSLGNFSNKTHWGSWNNEICQYKLLLPKENLYITEDNPDANFIIRERWNSINVRCKIASKIKCTPSQEWEWKEGWEGLGFKLQLCHLLALKILGSYLTSPCLNHIPIKVRIMEVTASQGWDEI